MNDIREALEEAKAAMKRQMHSDDITAAPFNEDMDRAIRSVESALASLPATDACEETARLIERLGSVAQLAGYQSLYLESRRVAEQLRRSPAGTRRGGGS